VDKYFHRRTCGKNRFEAADMIPVVVGEHQVPDTCRVDAEHLHVREQHVSFCSGIKKQPRLLYQAGEPPVRREPFPAGDVVVDFGYRKHERLRYSGLSFPKIMLPDEADREMMVRGSERPGCADEKDGRGVVTR
jgi:hypothetical protein